MNFQKGYGLTIGNLKRLDKQFWLLLFSMGLLLFVLYKSHLLDFRTGKIEMIVMQNRVNIKNIDQKKDIEYQSIYYINRLNFTRNRAILSSLELGDTGYRQNFFVDFQTNFTLREDKKVDFIIHSDDGFNLIIDNTNKMSFKGNRPIGKNSITLVLKKGKHHLKLEYYQGYGDLGIKAEYRVDKRRYIVGDNSDFLIF